MMQKMVRYRINACVRTCRIQRSNPDGVFLIRRGIGDAEDGALSRNRVGDCSLFEQSTSHTTVRTVRYTAVQIPSCLICIVSFSVVPSSNTRHSCIPFAFHAISLQAVLSVFCFHHVGLLSPVTQDWYLFSPSRKKKRYYDLC